MEQSETRRRSSPKCKSSFTSVSSSFSGNLSTAGKALRLRKTLQTESIILTEDDVIDRWTRVREEKHFSADVDVARFLLSWYLDGGGEETKSGSRCSHCQTPLSLYCQTCQLSPAFDNTSNRLEILAADGVSSVVDTVTVISIKEDKTESCADDTKIDDSMTVKEDKTESCADDTEIDDSVQFGAVEENYDSTGGDSNYNDIADIDKTSDSNQQTFNNKANRDGHRPAKFDSFKIQSTGSVCLYCNIHFDTIIAYVRHMRLHQDQIAELEDGRYKCKFCAGTLKTFELLCKHIRLQIGESACAECDRVLVSKCELTKHKKFHRREKQLHRQQNSKLHKQEERKNHKQRYCHVCDLHMVKLKYSQFKEHLKRHQLEANCTKKEKKRESDDDDGSGSGVADEYGGVKSYVCPYCKLKLSGPTLHATHMKTHSDLFMTEENERYMCKYCQTDFKSFKNVCEHVRLKAGELSCSGCGEEVVSRCDMIKHRRKHRLEKSRYCAWCQKSFTTLTNSKFAKHVRKHKREDGHLPGAQSGIVCSVCGKLYPDKYSLKDHMKRLHTTETPFTCDFPGCGRRFKVCRDLGQHRAVHGEKKKICELCGMKFRRSVELARHMQVHYGKKFECEHCLRRFKTNCQLKEHVDAVHKGIKLFTCSICEKRFSYKSSLTKHLRCVHTDSRPFPCTECSSAFKTKPALEKHKLRHTNARPYKCVDCDLCFRDLSTFSCHRKAKHRDSLYACTVCRDTFHIPQSLRVHMQMCHIEVPFDENKVVPTSQQQDEDIEVPFDENKVLPTSQQQYEGADHISVSVSAADELASDINSNMFLA